MSSSEFDFDVEEMMQWCEPRRYVTDSEPKQVKMKRIGRRDIRRKVPLDIKRAIVILTFNSTTNFTEVVRKPLMVAKSFNLNYRTVQSVLRSFRKQHCDLENFCDERTKTHTDYSMFDENGLGEYLLSNDCL